MNQCVITSDNFVPSSGTEPLTVLYSDQYHGTTVIESDCPGALYDILTNDEIMKIAKNQTPTFTARISDSTGEIIEPGSITAITYTISHKGFGPLGHGWTPVTGHNGVSLSKPSGSAAFAELLARPVADLFWEGLQTGDEWLDPDETEETDTSRIRGYNFKHSPDTRVNPAFSEEGEYLVQYRLSPRTGNPIVLSWKVTVDR